MKICVDCRKKNVPNDSRSKRCGPCRKERHAKQLRDYRKSGRAKKVRDAWRSKEPKRTWLVESWGRVKTRCARFGWNFERHDVDTPDLCPILGIELDYAKGCKTPQPNSPSFDRTDPTKGYVPGNVKVVSMRANLIKSNATEDELAKVLRYVRRLAKAS